jgi:hypothetical protein
LACFLLLLLGCSDSSTHSKRVLSADDFKDLKVDEYALSSSVIKENLEHLCHQDKSSGFAAQYVREYYEGGGPFVWVDVSGADSRSDTLLSVVEDRLLALGFSPKAFRIPQIKIDLERLRTLQFDQKHTINVVLPRLEYNLTRAFLAYVAGQRFGFINPNYVLNRFSASSQDSTGRALAYHHLYDVDIERPTANFARKALGHISVDSLGPFLRRQEPSDSFYARLLTMLRESTGDRQRILVNMERCRWRGKLQPKPGQKYVVVNVPAYHLWGVSADTIIDMRAACGALKTKTPLLSSQINLMQVNPEWAIPMSIVRGDVARHGGDSSYFARHRYYITDRKTGKRLSPRNVTSGMLYSGNYRVAQEGGAGNSLGRIIFRFPNNFSVFLHDTSSPGVFQRDNRGVSHGCVRVQRPFDLAVFMMEKDPDPQLLDRMRISMGIKPETEWGQELLEGLDPAQRTPQLVHSVPVSPRVPIFITYYTIFLTPDGLMQYYPDVYGYDGAVGDALQTYIND